MPNCQVLTKKLLQIKQNTYLKTFDSIYYRDKSQFEEDGTQNYLVFQTLKQE